MKKYLSLLSKIRLFNGIGEQDLLALLNCLGAKTQYFDGEYTIFAENDSLKYIGVLLSGYAQTVRVDYNGNRNILSEIHAGEIFGESFACADIPSAVSVVAIEPSEVMFIPSEKITRACCNACDFHQKLIYNLLQELAVKNVAFHQKMQIISKRSTREKLLTFLNIYAKKAGSNSFEIPFDRQALADYLQVERSGLSMEISKLKEQGIIQCHKNKFKLLK